MLKLSLIPSEYITINGDIVVQLTRVAGGRAYLGVEADRNVPILRGAVSERQGAERPDCLVPSAKKPGRHRRDQVFRWNDDRERAVRAMRQVLDKLERQGALEEVKVLRKELDRIIPAFWEEELGNS